MTRISNLAAGWIFMNKKTLTHYYYYFQFFHQLTTHSCINMCKNLAIQIMYVNIRHKHVSKEFFLI